VLADRLLGVATLSALLFGTGAYGLLGMWLSPARWREGLPASALVVGALPFGDHAQTFVGYPMRIATAAIVGDWLAVAGIAAVGIDTILLLENSVSQVDLPCSGVKSLWTGTLFLVAATWIERRPLNWRWLFVALTFAALLFAANVARVGVLVLVGEVLLWRTAAEMLHVPLGILAFAAACLAGLKLLRLVGRPVTRHAADDAAGPDAADAAGAAAAGPDAADAGHVTPRWLAASLLAALVLLGFVPQSRPPDGLARALPLWSFPAELVTTSVPLTFEEVAWLTRDGAESADRRRFDWRGIHGSMLLVPSTTWRAHHRPERCFEVHGLEIHGSASHLVAPDFPVRVVGVSANGVSTSRTAAYWFQSQGRVTDDYASRLWADLTQRPTRWVLVSILLDETLAPDDVRLRDLYQAIRTTIQEAGEVQA
jgi:exosortase O